MEARRSANRSLCPTDAEMHTQAKIGMRNDSTQPASERRKPTCVDGSNNDNALDVDQLFIFGSGWRNVESDCEQVVGADDPFTKQPKGAINKVKPAPRNVRRMNSRMSRRPADSRRLG